VIKNVLLINPPNTMPGDSVRRIGEPLGLLYLGAALEKKGYNVSVFDMACEGYDNCSYKDGYITYGSSYEDLIKIIKKNKPDIVGISCMFTARDKNTRDVCSEIRKYNKNIPIVLGGLQPSLFPKSFIDDSVADFVIMGEGEERFVKLLNCINNGKRPRF
jgi:anaerobic magnesium-protoporphyrin IX monomethyl ester cyclase